MNRQLNIYVSGNAKLDYSRDTFGNFNNQLLNTFEKSNFKISTLEESDLLVLVNHSNEVYRQFQKLGKNKNNAVLIRSEPVVVFPAQYRKNVLDKYGLVITLGYKEKDNGDLYYLENPYTYLPNPNLQMSKGPNINNILESKNFNDLFELKKWKKRKITMSLICSNKVSSVGESNYDLRRSLAKAFSKNFLEIYGELWNANTVDKVRHRVGVALHGILNLTSVSLRSIYGSFLEKYENYVGVVEDKHEIMQKSKFSLIIENSNEYMSEKLFDALMDGSIPVYYGVSLEKMGIPGDEIAIQHSGTPNELEKKINNLSDSEILNYLISIRRFLHSEQFKGRWNSDVVYKKIANKVRKFYDLQN